VENKFTVARLLLLLLLLDGWNRFTIVCKCGLIQPCWVFRYFYHSVVDKSEWSENYGLCRQYS